jgi:hypothetical protein
MPEGVYRYLSCKAEPKLVEAAMVCFVSPRLEEAVLILAQIKYQDAEGDVRSVCKEWDLWQLYFEVARASPKVEASKGTDHCFCAMQAPIQCGPNARSRVPRRRPNMK